MAYTQDLKQWEMQNGREAVAMVGDYVMPDGWQTKTYSEAGAWLKPDDLEWDACDFRLPAGGPMHYSLAVKVEVTGRKVHVTNSGASKVRVRVEFVGDGEPSTFSGGWMYLNDEPARVASKHWNAW